MNDREVRLTVLICTRDRADKLEAALTSIARCTVPADAALEVVVVDNGSTDGTPDVVGRFSRTAPFAVRTVREPRKGKSRALNTGVEHARGSTILFTDDDVQVRGDWIARVVDEYRFRPGLAGLGGRVELLDPTALRVAVRPSRERSDIGVDDLRPSSVPIIGCNMSLRRDLILDAGGFDERFGPGSRTGCVSEDLDLLYRVCLRGHRLVYVPEIVVLHDHGRRTRAEMVAIHRGYGRGRGAFYCKYLLRGDRRVARSFYWELRSLLSSRVRPRRSAGDGPNSRQVLGWIVSGAIAYALVPLARGIGSRDGVSPVGRPGR